MQRLNRDELQLLGMQMDLHSILNLTGGYKKFKEKVFDDEIFWKNKLRKDYPLLEKYLIQSWKNLYLSMYFYICKINNKFGIPYIPEKSFYPIDFYKYNCSTQEALDDAMICAAKGGCLDIMKKLLEMGAREGKTAIQWAAYNGHLDIVEFLIKMDKKCQNKQTYIHVVESAIYSNHLDIVYSTIEKGSLNIDDFNQIEKLVGIFSNFYKKMRE
jgi:ankyrin repeat protein